MARQSSRRPVIASLLRSTVRAGYREGEEEEEVNREGDTDFAVWCELKEKCLREIVINTSSCLHFFSFPHPLPLTWARVMRLICLATCLVNISATWYFLRASWEGRLLSACISQSSRPPLNWSMSFISLQGGKGGEGREREGVRGGDLIT